MLGDSPDGVWAPGTLSGLGYYGWTRRTPWAGSQSLLSSASLSLLTSLWPHEASHLVTSVKCHRPVAGEGARLLLNITTGCLQLHPSLLIDKLEQNNKWERLVRGFVSWLCSWTAFIIITAVIIVIIMTFSMTVISYLGLPNWIFYPDQSLQSLMNWQNQNPLTRFLKNPIMPPNISSNFLFQGKKIVLGQRRKSPKYGYWLCLESQWQMMCIDT